MRKWMVVLAVCVIFSAGVSGNVLAQEDTHSKAAEAFLLAMDTPVQLDEGITVMVNMMMEAEPAMEPFRQAITDFYQKYLRWEALKDEYVTIAKDLLSEQELKDATAFFQTESGRIFVEKQPEIFQRTSEMGFRVMQENQQELMNILQAQAQMHGSQE